MIHCFTWNNNAINNFGQETMVVNPEATLENGSHFMGGCRGGLGKCRSTLFLASNLQSTLSNFDQINNITPEMIKSTIFSAVISPFCN